VLADAVGPADRPQPPLGGDGPVEPSGTPEEGYYFFNDDLTDHAIAWIRQQKALMPDKPFFAYFATGATHAPSRPQEVDGPVQGPLRPGLGQAPGGDLRPPEAAENTDHHVGLLLHALENLQLLNDTLIYLIIEDNDASAEGSLQGTLTR
jgi:arylsulfatase A-like enzyme